MNLNDLFPICPGQTSNTTLYNCLGNTNIPIQTWDFVLGSMAVAVIVGSLIGLILKCFKNKNTTHNIVKSQSEGKNV